MSTILTEKKNGIIISEADNFSQVAVRTANSRKRTKSQGASRAAGFNAKPFQSNHLPLRLNDRRGFYGSDEVLKHGGRIRSRVYGRKFTLSG